MKPTILQRLLFFVLLLGALALGLVVASGFLLLAILLVPIVLIRFYLHKRAFEKKMTARTSQRDNINPEQSTSSSSGTVIEGEIVKKADKDH